MVDSIIFDKFYNNLDNLMSIQTQVKFREMVFINPTSETIPRIRYMSANSVDLILKNMRNFRFNERQFNIYYSLARFDFSGMNKNLGIPPFSFNYDNRQPQKIKFINNFEKYILSYDFCIDFDYDEKRGFKALYSDVKLVKNQFDVRKIPYVLIFSGRGFYIIVAGKYFWHKIDNPLEKIAKFSNVLKNVLNVQSIDEKVYDLRRVVKCYDTIDVRSGNVCLPLSDEDFIKFDIENKKVSDFYYRNFDLGSYHRTGEPDSFVKYMVEMGVLI